MTEQNTSCDIAVVGGGLGGCFTALGAARAGKRVVLVEHGTFLGREFNARLRLWIGREGWDGLPRELRELLLLPDCPEADVDLDTLPDWTAEEMPLLRGALKKRLLAMLSVAGVQVLFQCRGAGVVETVKGVRGIVIANKHGLQLLSASSIVDATAKADFMPGTLPATAIHHYSIGYAGARVPEDQTQTVPPELGLVDNCVRFHAGASGLMPVVAEFAFPSVPGNAAEIEARRLAVELTRHLTRNAPDFSEATVSEVALETACAEQRDWAGEFIPQGLTRAPCDLPLEARYSDVAGLYKACMEHGAVCARETPRTLDVEAEFVVQSGEAEIPSDAFSLRPFHDPKLALTLTAMDLVFPDFLPLREQCDVLVAGGGTAGANTALAALSKGATTVLMEANADLGGTQTLGMVASYFHGYKGGWTERQEQRLATFNDNLHNERKGARWATKLLFYDRSADEAGATCLFNCTVCGGLVENGQVSGLIGADSDGLFRVQAEVTVDATGDGDAAVFCGAQATFGCPRTGNVQDYSQWSKGKGGTWGTTSKNLDLDVIDQRFLSENLRGLRIAHKKGFDYDFVPMLTVREGRHIVGEYTIDMVDILEGRTFADGIAEAQTTWDPHGISSSWLGRLGFLPVHCDSFYVQIPYRSCVPKGLSGLLITAKAISATVDAACFCRMAADVQNLGWATGLAAAEATARHGGDVRAIDIKALHRHLAEMGIVRSDDPHRAKVAGTPAERVRRLAEGDETALLDVAVLPSEQALPQLRIALDSPDSDRVNIARALAWFGDASGAAILRETLAELAFHESALYDDTHPHKEGNPRAGIVDELDDYWRINQLLTLLGRIGDQSAAPQVASIIERTSAGGKPLRELNKYIAGRIDMQRVPHFDRLLCIAFCVERLGTSKLAAPMEWLLDREWIGGQSTRDDEDAAGPLYHSALAEVKLAAAAARCGSRKGLARLVEYLDDLHEILSAFAHRELAAVTGVDFGRDADAWAEWLATQTALPCAPAENELPVF